MFVKMEFCRHISPNHFPAKVSCLDTPITSCHICLCGMEQVWFETCLILLKYWLIADKVDRPVSTSIYFLLPAGSVSKLHRIPCAETWHFYLGEPITIVELNENDGSMKLTCLGQDLMENQMSGLAPSQLRISASLQRVWQLKLPQGIMRTTSPLSGVPVHLHFSSRTSSWQSEVSSLNAFHNMNLLSLSLLLLTELL